MSQSLANDRNNLTDLQLEFLKSLKYMATEEQLADIKSLLRFYFTRQLDEAIKTAEKKYGYTAAIYETWLKENPARKKSPDA